MARNLRVLATAVGTDEAANGYTPFYARHFAPIRRQPLRILEIGIYKGASLRLWRDFFPAATVVGIDLNPITLGLPGVHLRYGSQDDPAFLDRVWEEFGPFDIVIDDGSHQQSHIKTTFGHLYRLLAGGGRYVMEDIATAYWEEYEGGPVGLETTAVAMVKGLIDSVFRDAIREGSPPPEPEIAEMHVDPPALVFLRKPE